uniref:PiggyBac transposable element-derived protein domain-containing protein n=1 Tax=Knipowitschia caucasica TaxID=637954 RepID=A0AAV2J2Y6_KNICA
MSEEEEEEEEEEELWIPSRSPAADTDSDFGDASGEDESRPTTPSNFELGAIQEPDFERMEPVKPSKQRGRQMERGARASRGRSSNRSACGSMQTEWMKEDWCPRDIPFTATPGPRGAAAQLTSDKPIDFVNLFITDALLETIAEQTNLYAEQTRID